NLDPEDVAARVTDRTRALMPVHLFGRVMPLQGLTELGIPIIEDAAQAYGAQGVAKVGALSTFSFFPTKNLFALGDGGLVAATDEPAHVYHMYVVRSPDRDRFREALSAAGIGNASYYVTPLHLQPALRYLGWQAGSLPETEKASAENLALPMWAGIPAETQER